MISPQFDLLFDTKYWPNSGSFSNSEGGSSYLPKFGAHALHIVQLKFMKYLLFVCISLEGKLNFADFIGN